MYDENDNSNRNYCTGENLYLYSKSLTEDGTYDSLQLYGKKKKKFSLVIARNNLAHKTWGAHYYDTELMISRWFDLMTSDIFAFLT